MELQILRKIKKLSQYDIAIRTGIHQSKLSLLERGYLMPKDTEKISIAAALGVATSEIEWPIIQGVENYG